MSKIIEAEREKCESCGKHAPLNRVKVEPDSVLAKLWDGVEKLKICDECLREMEVIGYVQQNENGFGIKLSEVSENTDVARVHVRTILEKHDYEIKNGAKAKRAFSK